MENDYDEYARRMNPNESPDDVVDGPARQWRWSSDLDLNRALAMDAQKLGQMGAEGYEEFAQGSELPEWLRGEVEPRMEDPEEEEEAMKGWDDASFSMELERWLERTMAVEELTAVSERIAARVKERLEEQKAAARKGGILKAERSDKGTTRS